MKITILTHRKLPKGDYFLEVKAEGEVYSFTWAPKDGKMTVKEYEAMQVREAKLLIENAKSSKGRKASTEGQEF